jgi:signal transduction histidine kinase
VRLYSRKLRDCWGYFENSKVTISVEQKGKTIEVNIKDTGRGIDKRYIPNLFTTFFQVQAAATRTEGGLV